MKRWMMGLGLAVLAVVGVGVYKTLTPPGHLYAVTGEFAGCPSRPNCVSSVASDDEHRVASLAHTGDTLRAVSMLREVIERMDGRVVRESDGYLHAVFTTPTMRFRDDVELLVHADGRIDVRSISRFGYRDFGVNRDRVEELRRNFEATP